MSQEKVPFLYDPEWTVYGKRADFMAIGKRYGIDPVIARVIRNRDFVTNAEIDDYLNGTMTTLHEPSLMKDMDKATDIMLEKLRQGKKVRIISDYDVDGVSSNYILYKGLARAIAHLHPGANDLADRLDYAIPHRVYDGYGLNVRLVDSAKDAGVDTIITCDNGIAAYNEVAHAKDLGMTVIVTDHHDVPYDEDEGGKRIYRIPPADAVVDHKQEDCDYPEKELCGAGVAYKFIQLLYRKCGIDEEEVRDFVEILGVATVCDVMNLVGENRIFVRESLEKMQHTTNPGLKALLECSGRADKKLGGYDYGFIIGPCINAAGRLGDATTSLEFLLEEDTYRAGERAVELVNINNERKLMTEEGLATAVDMLENADLATEEASLADKVLVMYIPNVHESLVGIIAGRVKEKYYRPVLLFTDSEEEGIIKGSGRSIEGYHMYDAINKFGELFTKYGGHEMAAGFSLLKEKLQTLRKCLNDSCGLDKKVLTPKLRIDVPMPLDYITVGLVEQLSLLEPFGKGNEKPTFAQAGVTVQSFQILGKNKNVLKARLLMNNGKTMDALSFDPAGFVACIKEWFGADACDKMERGMPTGAKLDVAYYPDINEYMGRVTLQVRILEYRKHEAN